MAGGAPTPRGTVPGAGERGVSAEADAERVDVMALHDPIMREKRDPRDGYEPVPLWLAAAFGALLFWGGWYLATYSGGFRSDVLDERPEARYGPAAGAMPGKPMDSLVLGQQLFKAKCAPCHQADGTGIPGKYPPLAGSEWVLGPTERTIRIVLHGLEGPVRVKGDVYADVMPTFAGQLDDGQIAAVLSFVRGHQPWGNGAGPVAESEVAAIRAATKARNTPWTATELMAFPAK